MLHGLQADVSHRAQGVEHLAVLDFEVGARAVDVRRADGDAHAPGVLVEHGQLVGVGQIEAHRGREELHRAIGLQPAGLVRDQGVGGGVALVEAVAGELGHQVEDAVGLLGRHALLGGAGDEPGLLQVHLLLFLLAHGPAQQIGLAQGVAGQDLGDLHHLFLVDDDAVGLLQHRLQRGVQGVHRLAAELAVDEGVDVVHRARPIKRDQGGDVLDRARTQLAQGVAHALAFQLEHAHGLALGHQLVGRRVVEGQLGKVDLGPALGQVLDRPVEHGERLQAQEVELHQAGALDPLHVELGGRQLGARVSIERAELGQGPVADHHPGGVGRGVAVEPLEAQGDGQQVGHGLVLVAGLAQARLDLDGLG